MKPVSPQQTSHTWNIFQDTESVLESIYSDLKESKESIYIEAFILNHDAVGERFLELLTQKASEGVQVRILVDSIGSLALGNSLYMQKFKTSGVHIRFFNWLLPFSKHNKKLWYFRNHRRIILIDKKTLYTGGFCFGKRMEKWRDTSIRIEGPITEQAAQVAEKTWKKVYKKRYVNLGREWRTNVDNFSFVTQAPLPGERFLYHSFIDAIKQAKSYVYITTPYFLPDHKLYRVLRQARKRGVQVKILVPERSDHRIVDHGSHTYYHTFLSKKMEIYQYPRMIHAKTAVIDDEWSMIGTLNMDNISLRYNFECAIVSTNSDCAKELRTMHERDLAESKKVTLEAWENRSFLEKCKDMLVWPIRKLL
ncbi:MAG: hypothetical protein FGM57_00935 [Candidatus Taylorbacteria bacterium]|nr:hypothetical protein [Candidatus Taylorbacteria bacterium]